MRNKPHQSLQIAIRQALGPFLLCRAKVSIPHFTGLALVAFHDHLLRCTKKMSRYCDVWTHPPFKNRNFPNDEKIYQSLQIAIK